jgi:hypothetical protein
MSVRIITPAEYSGIRVVFREKMAMVQLVHAVDGDDAEF